jgi:hypothetical protein
MSIFFILSITSCATESRKDQTNAKTNRMARWGTFTEQSTIGKFEQLEVGRQTKGPGEDPFSRDFASFFATRTPGSRQNNSKSARQTTKLPRNCDEQSNTCSHL